VTQDPITSCSRLQLTQFPPQNYNSRYLKRRICSL